MTDKQIIINGVDVSGCIYRQYDMCTATKDNYGDCSFYCKDYEMKDCYYKQLKRKEQECEELHSRTASIIYSLTGGRLSYSTYTLEGCEQAYHDQLEIDVERATKELEEKLQAKEQECEELKKIIQRHDNDNNALLKEVEDKLCEYYRRYKECLTEIIRFFKEDEKFARYSGRPIIFVKPTLEKLEKILKENDIKIS